MESCFARSGRCREQAEVHEDNKEELFLKWGSVRSLIEGERAYDASVSREDASESSKEQEKEENIKGGFEWLLEMGNKLIAESQKS